MPKLLFQKRFVSDTAIFVLKRDDKLQPTSRTGEGSKPEWEMANQDGMMVWWWLSIIVVAGVFVRTLVSRLYQPTACYKWRVASVMRRGVLSLRWRQHLQHHHLQLMPRLSRHWPRSPRQLMTPPSLSCLPTTRTITPPGGIPDRLPPLGSRSTWSGDARTTWHASVRARHINSGWWTWKRNWFAWRRWMPDFESVSWYWREPRRRWSRLLLMQSNRQRDDSYACLCIYIIDNRNDCDSDGDKRDLFESTVVLAVVIITLKTSCQSNLTKRPHCRHR